MNQLYIFPTITLLNIEDLKTILNSKNLNLEKEDNKLHTVLSWTS